MYEWSAFQVIEDIFSAAKCGHICASHDDCAFWTWWKDPTRIPSFFWPSTHVSANSCYLIAAFESEPSEIEEFEYKSTCCDSGHKNACDDVDWDMHDFHDGESDDQEDRFTEHGKAANSFSTLVNFISH